MRKKLKTILPLLLIIYIALDTILKINNVKLCSSTGCELAGELLKFNSIYLNYLGIAGALFLVFVSLLKRDKLYATTAVAMVAFETLLIASQLNLNPEVCKFCLGVYSLLLLILLNSKPKVFLYIVPTIIAIFVAFSTLSIPKNKTLISKDGLYLISSKSCPHCTKTKTFLNKEDIKYQIIKAEDINSYHFAKSLNIRKIPIAIEKKADNYTITVGDKRIIAKYGIKQIAVKEEPTTSQAEVINPLQPKLNLSGEEGCSYNPIEEPSCESKVGSSK